MTAALRRVLHVFLWLSVRLLALVLVVVLGAVIAVQTDWGRGRIRATLESTLSKDMNGRIRIGRLDGNVLGTMVVSDIRLTDRYGRSMIAIDRATVSLGLFDLLQKELHFDKLDLDGGRVTVF